MNAQGPINVLGIGWFTADAYGCIRSGVRQELERGEAVTQVLARKGFFHHPFRNLGRLDVLSRMTAYAVALALRDAGIGYEPGRKKDIGIIITSKHGSLLADQDYFEDYVGSGRTLGRGNLFIYTLPSSPAGESAIHFGLLGPMFYAAGAGNSLIPLIEEAESIVSAGEAEAMLVGIAEAQEALYMVLAAEHEHSQQQICGVDAAREIASNGGTIEMLVRQFSAAGKALREDQTYIP